MFIIYLLVLRGFLFSNFTLLQLLSVIVNFKRLNKLYHPRHGDITLTNQMISVPRAAQEYLQEKQPNK